MPDDNALQSVSPPNLTQGNLPLYGDPGQPAEPSTVVPAGATTPAPTSSKPSLWKEVLQGALAGLAGSKGATSFGGGLAGGASGYIEEQQRQIQNANVSKQLQFESVRAADSHISALDQHRQANQLSAQEKLNYTAKSAEYQAFLQNNFGIAPDLSFNDSHNEATAGLTTVSNNNGGTIPPVATVQHPSVDGEHGKISAYSPSQQQFNQNMSGYRNLINTTRAVQGMPPIDDASFNSMGFKGARDAALGAIEFLKPTPTFSLDKNSPNYLPTVLAQKQQQLQQYQNHKDADGKVDADPNVISQLENGIEYLQNSWDSTNKMENDASAGNIKATAPAKADAAKQETIAKEQTPGGQATLTKNIAQGEMAETQATLNKEALGRIDDFGNKVGLPGDAPKDIKSKQDKFNKSYVEPLAPLVKSNMEFNRILASGDKMTPAEKVTGLLQAVGISFDPLKGKGARLNNDIIQEHAGARDIYQGALQRIDQLRPGGGGPITQKQISDYADIARGVVHDAYVYNAREAARQGLPVDFLPKASKPGEMAPDDVLKIYVDAANGDQQKALAALIKAGYK